MKTPDFLDLFFCTLGRHQPVDRAEQAQALERAIQADPGDRASRLALAECLRRLGRLDEADSNLDSLPPTDPDVLAVRALVALDRGDRPRAQALVGAGLAWRRSPGTGPTPRSAGTGKGRRPGRGPSFPCRLERRPG